MLLISADLLGSELAGVSIRAYELARALAPHAEVTLAGLATDSPPPSDVRSVTYELRAPQALWPHIDAADIVVAQPQWPPIARRLRASGAQLIFDLYDPEPFEVLEYLASRPRSRRLVLALSVDRIVGALHDGDQFLCAGEKQRDLWIGALLGERLIDTRLYSVDPTLRSLIDTVPFGAPDAPPQRKDRGLRERFPEIGADDPVALWGGGIWNWLDAPTAIRAAGLLAEARPSFRLVFMGASTAGPAREATAEAKRLAGQLGLIGRTVFFNESWVPYSQRGDWLLDADCGVSTHTEHLETRFAFRTRMLDCFWAGLPVVCTQGDELAARVERDGLGATVPIADPGAVAAAVGQVLERGRGAYAPALERAWREHMWSHTTEALVRYVTSDPPPPRPRGSRRVSHRLRDQGFRAALATINALGVKRMPFLR